MNRTATSYLLEELSTVEVVRLLGQASLMREYVPLVPPYLEDILLPDILDIGCGPGSWVLDVAFDLPDARVIGLDINADMVNYAQGRACSQHLHNVSFELADAREHLPFAPDTFDLVHVQLATSWVQDDAWLPLLREIHRVLKAGASVMITESQLLTSNSPALQRLNQLLVRLMQSMQLGRCQDNILGVIAALGPLLHQARFFALTLHEVEIPCSSTMPPCDTRWFSDLLALFCQLRQQVVKQGLVQHEDYSRLLEQFTREAQSQDFFGYSTVFTFTARR